MIYYFAEILGPFDCDYRFSQVRELESNLLKGWMLPKLGEIRPV
jgi:hypothetical protein